LRASASVGAWLASAASAPAARLALGVGLERPGAAPFVEAAVLGAAGGGGRGFAAVQIAAGIRLGVKR
jgi:hypothetical protein